MATVFEDGFESGDMSNWTAQDGGTNITEQSSVKYEGTYAARANPATSTCRAYKTITGTATGGIALRGRRGASTGDTPIFSWGGQSINAFMVYLQDFGGTMRLIIRDVNGLNDYVQDTVAMPAVGDWFLIEYAWDVSAATWKVKWRLNGTDRGEFTQSGADIAATTFNTAGIGTWGYNLIADMFFDNVKVVDTYTYPIVGDRVYRRLTGPAHLTGSAATLFTASERTRILHIHASNPSSSPVDLNLSIGADAAATRVYDDYEIAPDSIEHNYDPYDLAAGDIIQGWASTAGTVVLTITGYEDPA